MKRMENVGYIFSFIIISGFYCLIFRNSPKHANIYLIVVAVSFGISFIRPREKFRLVALVFGIVGVFFVIIKSRNVREASIQTWITEKEFQRVNISFVDDLFNTAAIGTSSYYTYKGVFRYDQKMIPCLMAIRYTSNISSKSASIILDCSYYFNGKIGADILEQKFEMAKANTPHTNLWKSNLRFFDLNDCEIFRPAVGGIVVSWRVPDTVEGYNDRYEWVKKTLND